MSAGRSFRSLFMVTACATAALSCYLVSLRVASERSALEDVETEIVMAQRDLRVLQTEIGTRGRLAQLERWNARVLALSAPTADQFLAGSFELAKLARPEEAVAIDAPVVLASAPAPSQPSLEERVVAEAAPAPSSTATATFTPKGLMNQASLKTGREIGKEIQPKIGTREVPANAAATPSAAGGKSKDQLATAAKPAKIGSSDRPGLAAAKSTVDAGAKKPAKTETKKTVDKPALSAAKPVTKPSQVAKADPLAPLPSGKHGSTHKEPATKQ